MTPQQATICKALAEVSYTPGSWDKKFANSIGIMARANGSLSLKQNESMFRLLYKYRKELPELYALHQNNPLCAYKTKQP